ncbi:MAG: prohibitin family protein [Anaerolineae bacterium]|nr:prohibitin family protein [Anaerolineae bacterium]
MAISSIFGTLALVGFVVFLVGAGLAVVSASQGRPARGGISLSVIGLVVGLIFSVISSGLLIVEPTQVAIVTNTLNGTIEEPRGGGVHIIAPVVQQVSAIYDLRQQEFSMLANPSASDRTADGAVQAQTRDGQQVSLDVTVIYRVVPDQADELYRAWRGDGFREGFVRPVTRSVVRDVVSTYSAEELYAEKRATLSPDIRDALDERYTGANLELMELVVRDIDFSPDFAAAIEQKVIAQQNLERARTDAERAQTEAEGRANAAIASAQGEAQSTEIRARAQAEALRLVSEQIAANPSLIQYEYVQNLSDNVQLILVPSNSPFLFDFESLTQGGTPGFTAPVIPEATPAPPAGS